VRIAAASVALTTACAGGAMMFGSVPAHHSHTQQAAPDADQSAGIATSDAPSSLRQGPGGMALLDTGGRVLDSPTPHGTKGKPTKTSPTARPSSKGSSDKQAPAKAPASQAAEVPSQPHTSAPAGQGTSSSTNSGPVTVSGQVSCSSGNAVVGVWVEADKGAGWSPWKGVGDGANADYWYTLPRSEQYSLHIGCGGSPDSWRVAVETPYVGGTHNSFDCFDVPGRSGYKTCRLR
jgi:hypothetical protein